MVRTWQDYYSDISWIGCAKKIDDGLWEAAYVYEKCPKEREKERRKSHCIKWDSIKHLTWTRIVD